MKKVLLLLHDHYADFQIGHVLFFLNKLGKAEITTCTVEGAEVISLGGLRIKPDYRLDRLNITDYDLLLIPGGDGIHLAMENEQIFKMIKSAYESNVFIASICGSAVFLAKSGILKDKKFTCNDQTVDEYSNIFETENYTGANVETSSPGFITAKGAAFAQFTIAVLKELNLLQDKTQEEKVLAFCRGG